MSEVSTVNGIIRSAATGPAWHGPSVAESLDGITAGQAAAKPLGYAHSIWELVLHMDAWQVFALRTCEGNLVPTLKGDADWPPATNPNETAWAAAKAAFSEHAAQLQECINDWDDAKLREKVPAGEFSFKVLLHGIAHHNLYHGGQIGLLKRNLE